ncbi:MAG: hypothetical protein HY014_02085 [Acidobacteria bacterium]|nr:hypothetical protein [Acidobacteriota bacterium]MBI3486937.1 hypothetical protein [Acidobacteriota bacterium]
MTNKPLTLCLAFCFFFGGTNLTALVGPDIPQRLRLYAFEEPLDSLEGRSSADESAALSAALDAYVQAGRSDVTELLDSFLKAYPASPWSASLQMNMGLALKRNGWPGRAMDHFKDAWALAKAGSSPTHRRIADRAVTEWMCLCVKGGDEQTLAALLDEARARPMHGGAAQRRVDAERALFAMQKEAKFYLCGPTALATVNQVMKPGHPVDSRDVKDTIPGPNGTSLFQLAMMASHWDIPLQMLKRDPGAKVLTPSVMHWKIGHWAAVLRERGGRYLVQEDVLEESIWVTRDALDAETSGYCLAPYVPLPSGWTRVSAEEGGAVWGRGRVGLGPWYGPYSDSALRPEMPASPSTAKAGVRMGNLSLEVAFSPISIPRPDGPALPFVLRYQQRMIWQPDRPAYGHLGPHWTMTGISYLLEDSAFEGQDVHLFTEDGTWLRFTGFDPASGNYARNTHTRDLLVRVGPGSFELRRPDGRLEIYSHVCAAGASEKRVFRVESRTPQGRMLRYSYDGTHRLRRITDEAGKGFILEYEDPYDPWRLSRVVDSYGREARFIFGSDGNLTKVIDAAGQITLMVYPDRKSVEPDVLTGLITPEGAWTFEHGQAGLSRWVEVVDPSGKRHRSEFRHDAPGLPHVDASAPPGPLNQYMHDRSTYYWGPESLARHRGDYTKAESIRYLFNPTQLALSWTLEAVKAGAAPRVWFLYSGQVNTQVEGEHSNPRWMGQRTSKGDQTWDLRWDDLGRLTERMNGEGLHERWTYGQGAGLCPEAVASHQEENSRRWETDEDGRRTCLWEGQRRLWQADRNPHGAITAVHDAHGRVWKLDYDHAGRWVGVRGPVSYQWSYDALGRVATLREGSGTPMTLSYDGLDRVLGPGGVLLRPVKAREAAAVPQGILNDEWLRWLGFQKPCELLPIPSVARNGTARVQKNRRANEGARERREVQRGSVGPVFERWCWVLVGLEAADLRTMGSNELSNQEAKAADPVGREKHHRSEKKSPLTGQ